MKSILVTLFALCLTNAKAQFVEKIYLKDSITTYTGWVVEQVPQDYLKILRQKERDTIQVPTGNIWKIVQVLDAKASNPFAMAQGAGRSQAIYLEAAGNSFTYSLNYDTRLKKGKRDGWGLRVGAGVYKFHGLDVISNQKLNEFTLTCIPLQVNYLIGTKRNALELGAGTTLFFVNKKPNAPTAFSPIDVLYYRAKDFYPAPTSIIGYRYTALNNGFTFRASLCPMASIYRKFQVTGGISIGYHFGRR